MKQSDNLSLAMDNPKVMLGGLIFLLIGVFLYIVPAFILFDLKLKDFNIVSFLEGVILLALGLLVHELLHGLGWVIGGDLTWNDLGFGLYLSKGILFIHSRVPLKMKAYRIGILLPGLVLGIAAPLCGLFFSRWSLVWFGVFMFSGAAWDFILFWWTRKIPGHVLIVDHPTKIGIKVVAADHRGKENDKEVSDLDLPLVDVKTFLGKGFGYVILFSLFLVGCAFFGFLVGKYGARLFSLLICPYGTFSFEGVKGKLLLF
ncbi:MAG TPA: DUF3267 domain-containing protein [Firmicutes bacterium]|nr:DUF3267 domain-containing protein [Bacillota bacterium]